MTIHVFTIPETHPKFIHICFSISSKGAVMVVIVWNSAYALKLWVQIPSWRGVLHSTLRDKVCQWLVTDWWFSLGTPVSSTNKTDHWYSWNIVESGVKHHNHNPIYSTHEFKLALQIACQINSVSQKKLFNMLFMKFFLFIFDIFILTAKV